MTIANVAQIVLYLAVLLLLVKPLGLYMAAVFSGERTFMHRVLGPVECAIYRVSGVKPDDEMTWKGYAAALLIFNGAGLVLLFVLQLVQVWLPLNPDGMGAVSADQAFNTAVSFVTNTNWQSYGGESTMSYLTQMAGLTVQNFLSAATGIAVLCASIRGFTRVKTNKIGNFWTDMTRATLYVLVPLSLILAVALVSQGVVQTFNSHITASMVEPLTDVGGNQVSTQTIAVGPVASQVAIKQLGTNGGGFFGVNSAHPFENPTPFSNLLQMLAILLIAAALCYTFGRMVKDTRQGWTILGAMLAILVPLLVLAVWSESSPNPLFDGQNISSVTSALAPGGNMEGKELRFGPVNSALWATLTTAASNGSVNSMHDSFLPLGGLVPLWLMQLGEVVFGGVGSGLYGMLLFAIVAVFIAGLMVGRTPEYLGKKIEAFEMKMAALGILIPCIAVLTGTALAVSIPQGASAVANPGTHGFSEILYAFSSAGNNNGSAFAGLSVNTVFYNLILGLTMLIARYAVIIPVLAVAGSLAAKKYIPPGPGTLSTSGPLFLLLLVGTVLLVGALTFIPALALGPIVEHLQMVMK